MRIVILYHPKSEFAREVETYVGDFSRQRGKDIELVSLETVSGAEMAKVYDIVQYPAILALRDDGSMSKNWQGSALPLMDEVAGYLHG